MIRYSPCFALAMLGVTLCGAGCTSAPDATTGPRPIKVVVLPYLTFAPLLIADDEGYFAEQGLDLEFVRMQRSVEAIPALDRGQLDVAGGTISLGVLNAIARGSRVRLVADKGYAARDGCTFAGLLARTAGARASNRLEAATVRQWRIAADRNSYTGYVTDRWLDSAGLAPDDVELVVLPDEVLAEALDRGAIDLAHTSEPWITQLVKTGHVEVRFPVQHVLPDSQYAFLLYGPNLLDRDPAAGQRFMVAYLRGVRRYLEGKTPRNIAILARHTGLDPALLQDACWPAFRETGVLDVTSVLDFQTWGRSKDLLDATLPAHRFWDARFVEHANRVLAARGARPASH